MKIILSGGGTGGHIYPAISIGKALEKKYPGVELLFVGTEKGMENEIIPNAHYRLRKIRVRGFQRKLSMDTIYALKESCTSLFEVKKILKEEKPDLVIGTGGYVCGPVVLVAALKGIPTLIHEQNAFPGMTNKILSRFVDRIAITFGEAAQYFNKSDKVSLTGNPLRDSFFENSGERGYRNYGFDSSLPLILVTGGSRGAKRINESVLRIAKHCADTGEMQLLHMTGKTQYDAVLKLYQERGIEPGGKSVRVVPYIDQMPDEMQAADLIISRCGAGALAELTALGKASVLIPYPYATDNHQEYNARALERSGAAVVITEKELSEDLLYDQVTKIIRDKSLLQQLARNSKKLGRPNAAADIASMAEALLNTKA